MIKRNLNGEFYSLYPYLHGVTILQDFFLNI